MFTAFVQNEYGQVVKQFDDCFKVAVLPERDMELLFPSVLHAYGVHSPYLQLVDSTGNHFYPLYVYSVEIG